MMNKLIFSNHSYSVRFRLITFLITAILLIAFISTTAIWGLNTTYNALSDLRDRSLNQMFSTMTLGVKTAQISTYATKLNQVTKALEYQAESRTLAQQFTQLKQQFDQLKQASYPQDKSFIDIAREIEILESSVQDLLYQTHQRHILHTTILSNLHQSLLHIRHLKRLGERVSFQNDFPLYLQHLERLLEDATQSSFASPVFASIQANFAFFPKLQAVELQQEFSKLTAQFPPLIAQADKLAEINLRIKFLTYQIDALVKSIDQKYTQLAMEKVENVALVSAQIQETSFKQILSIVAFSFFVILLIVVLGKYLYSLIGKRLYSITNALKRLAEGDKNITVPQQQYQDEIGDLARTFGIFYQNVITLEKTDLLLKEKSELLEHTFFAMRDGLAIFNQQHQLQSYNTQFSQLLASFFEQYQQALTLDQLVEFLAAQKAQVSRAGQKVALSYLQQIETQDVLEIEYQHTVLEWRISPLKEGFVIFLIDRTQRKKLENDLAHSQKMRAIGQLTGGIAHDFNNLLAVIIGNLELIDTACLAEKQQKRLQRALKAAENSATLTQRLLAYARKQPLRPQALDINQLVLEFQDLIKHSIPPSIQIQLNLAEALPPVYIDKTQLETALVNLMLNAKDALNQGGKITLSTSQRLVQRSFSQEQMVQLSIIDNGCGMDESTLKRVFEPFFTTKQNGRGSGLGLSMVYGFIRQSKGRILIDSAVGKGTKIHLQLPIVAMKSEIQLTDKPSICLKTQQTLLLVEDKLDLQQTLSEQLMQQGFEVITCRCAEQALILLEQHKNISYLLSDIVLEGKLTGLDLAYQAQQHYPNLHIVLMTGHSEQLEKSTAFPILRKPFKRSELLDCLTTSHISGGKR